MWPTVSWRISRNTTRPASSVTDGSQRLDGAIKLVVPTSSRASDGTSGSNSARSVFLKHDAGVWDEIRSNRQKRLGNLNNPNGVEYLGLRWRRCRKTCRSTWTSWNPQKHQQSKIHSSRKQLFHRLLAQVRCPVSRVLPQFACAASKPALIPKDVWSVEDLNDLIKLVVKVEDCKPIPVLRSVSSVKPVVLTALDASFAKDNDHNSRCRE